MGRAPLVLIAEDSPGGQFILRQLLGREGISPRVVSDGRAAVIAAEAKRYDVICMATRMPELDGLVAARRIRSGRGPSAMTPIIAMTASVTPEDIQACRDAGMTLLVPKPVGRERLLNAILTALTDPHGEGDQRPAADTRQSTA
jgi:CheY-like chemotaxis protein